MTVSRHIEIDLANADQLAAFYRELTSTSTTFIQLSSGPTLLKARSCELEGMSIAWVNADGHHIWHDRMLGGQWRFALMIESDGPIRLGGQDLHRDHAHLLRSGEDSDFVTRGSYGTLEITLEGELLDLLGWESSAPGLQRVDRSELAALRHLCEAAYRWKPPAAPYQLRDMILDRLEKILQPWLTSVTESAGQIQSPRTHKILMSVQDYLTDNDPGAAIDDIATRLGISRRTLFAAFRAELGIGPRRYMEIRRLNGLRERLRATDPGTSTVTTCANDFGFSELGRTAVLYRKLFGEVPSTTLRRRRDSG